MKLDRLSSQGTVRTVSIAFELVLNADKNNKANGCKSLRHTFFNMLKWYGMANRIHKILIDTTKY